MVKWQPHPVSVKVLKVRHTVIFFLHGIKIIMIYCNMQYQLCGLHEEVGRDCAFMNMQVRPRGDTMVRMVHGVHLGKVHSGEKENSGLLIKSSRSDHPYRMVSSSSGIRGHLQSVQLPEC